MDTIIKDDYLPIIRDDHLMVRHIFRYLINYLYEHKENDHLDMDFINAIIIFLDTYLIPVHFKREEEVLFKEFEDLSIPIYVQSEIKNIIHRHMTISNFVSELSLLRRQYETGSNSKINEIHSIMGLLTLSFNKLVIEQEKLFPKIDQYLTDLLKEKIKNGLNKFNENIIIQMVQQHIIEAYKKYDNHQ
ncbi:MAG: hypothetical protein A2Y40_00260 [Candidatus Margulisbacteria bacterium GWF2_35_9]|nr:MAG: hypothetical protein A2Y40_00260 [Candidatus Margulisbacteria bacterium GWF2_35_9]